MLGNLFGPREQETEEHWISISDVMAGLMVIFLFIAISYMLNVRLKTDEIIVSRNEVEKLLDAYKNLQAALYEELYAEFEAHPAKKKRFRNVWRGHLDRETLSIRFQKPFEQAEATVPDEFKEVLRDFFPRYIAILTKPEYRDDIDEIRIEGHTSNEWNPQVTGDRAYINNMELSQNRARNVLSYVLQMRHYRITQNRVWLKNKLTANGLSSSQLVPNLGKNRQAPANSYRTIARETNTPEEVVREIYQEIGNLQLTTTWGRIKSNIQITLDDIVKAVGTDRRFSDLKPETLERAVSLLTEDEEESRRVEFRVVTKSEKLINEIEQLLKQFNKAEVVN